MFKTFADFMAFRPRPRHWQRELEKAGVIRPLGDPRGALTNHEQLALKLRLMDRRNRECARCVVRLKTSEV